MEGGREGGGEGRDRHSQDDIPALSRQRDEVVLASPHEGGANVDEQAVLQLAVAHGPGVEVNSTVALREGGREGGREGVERRQKKKEGGRGGKGEVSSEDGERERKEGGWQG